MVNAKLLVATGLLYFGALVWGIPALATNGSPREVTRFEALKIGGGTFGSCGKAACAVTWSTCTWVPSAGYYALDIPNKAKECDWGIVGCDNIYSTECHYLIDCSDSVCSVGCTNHYTTKDTCTK
jgi:hypothetical protein